MTGEAARRAGALQARGVDAEELAAQLARARSESDTAIARGDMTYLPGADVSDAAQQGLLSAFESNAVYAANFPQVVRFERELVTSAAELFHAPGVYGSVTSGGTESIILAVLSARQRFRRLYGTAVVPEIVLPHSAHPAFWKAADYLGLVVVETRLDDDQLPDVAAFSAALGEHTALAVASAPSYPTGRVEPVDQLAAAAHARGVPLHVDGCLGGFFLPFAERLGARVGMPDFRIPGVTSISADLHKFGYASVKGTSVLVHRDEQGYDDRRWTFSPGFRTDDAWYGTENLTGSRSGGPSAAAWAVQRLLGEEGFLERTRETLAMMDDFGAAIEAIPGLRLVHRPDVPLISWTSDDFDIFVLAQHMLDRAWVVHADTWPVRCMRNLFPWGMRQHLAAFVADLSEGAALASNGELTSTASVSY